MAVSENRGTPKSSILIGFSIKPSILEYPYFWKPPYEFQETRTTGCCDPVTTLTTPQIPTLTSLVFSLRFYRKPNAWFHLSFQDFKSKSCCSQTNTILEVQTRLGDRWRNPLPKKNEQQVSHLKIGTKKGTSKGHESTSEPLEIGSFRMFLIVLLYGFNGGAH